MENMYTVAAIYLSLALISAILAYHLKISVALVEICVGMLVAFLTEKFFPINLQTNAQWVKFLSSSGAVFLTFLAGAELDRQTLSKKLKEVSIVGIIGFLAPFSGSFLIAHYILKWTASQSLLANCSFHNLNGSCLCCDVRNR